MPERPEKEAKFVHVFTIHLHCPECGGKCIEPTTQRAMLTRRVYEIESCVKTVMCERCLKLFRTPMWAFKPTQPGRASSKKPQQPSARRSMR